MHYKSPWPVLVMAATLSPEMTVTLCVIVIGMLLWRLFCGDNRTSSWKSSIITRTTSTSSTSAETQTEKELRQQGLPARYQGGRERARKRPRPRARENLKQVYRQLMKDVAKRLVLVVMKVLSSTMSSCPRCCRRGPCPMGESACT